MDSMGREGHERTRRSFLNWFLGTSIGALLVSILYPVARYLSPPEVAEASINQVEVGPANDPEFLGRGYKIVRFGNDPVIVVRVAEGDFRAFSATCTHLACIVEFRKAKQLIWCNCHNGAYDLTGRNVAGPPPRPLTPYQTHLAAVAGGGADTVIVSRS
jgi:Rieske Fe-S protein